VREEQEETDGAQNDRVGKDDKNNSEVAAVVVGSSNFGYRSFCRDMESNILLVFPPATNTKNETESGIAGTFEDEWNNLIASSKPEVLTQDENETSLSDDRYHGQEANVAATEIDTAKKPPPLPWPILKSVPYIKTFF